MDMNFSLDEQESSKEKKEKMNSIPNLVQYISKREYLDATASEISRILDEIGSIYSFRSKQQYVDRMEQYHKCINFTWRDDQKKVINKFVKYIEKNFVIHAVFGSGKTTLLLGMLIFGILFKKFKPSQAMFISFNISIRNEIKRKLKDYGLSSKISVRTFDSVVYEISKMANYPHIDLPNFDGKRRFVYEKTFDNSFDYIPAYQPRVIFIDECQDLEKNTLKILQKFYPKSKFVFSGDIFQSIQKEPRESILWHFMTNDDIPDTFKIYMRETPRVPTPVLDSIKKALNVYYPEFKTKINSWTSGNKVSNVDIEWHKLDSYNQIFDKVKNFTDKYEPQEGMILTFSSAITVRGNMGDVSRIRRFMIENKIPVNTNHKKLDPDTYFLSTANSSKGLERDYVIIFLTFPLERAFINLSDDVVVNLITVALTRAKKKVIMYVPKYEDKFTRVLNIFSKCPVPSKNDKIHEGKTLDEFSLSTYLNLEHSVTELIRMSIVKYDTRIDLFKYAKAFNFDKVFEDNINYKILPIITEEEKSFVGILIENLITSTWTNKWPSIQDSEHIHKNPMYNHIKGSIKSNIEKYVKFTSQNINQEDIQFNGIYLFSKIQTAISDKIVMNLKNELVQNMKGYWSKLKKKCHFLKPTQSKSEKNSMKIQVNMQMPWVKGIADAIVYKGDKDSKDNKDSKIELVEIKASQDIHWKDNALLQVLIYSLMSGKTWSYLHLLNPFRNEKVTYHFNSKNILSLRSKVINDVLIYNLNSFMAKSYGLYKHKKSFDVSNTLFVDITRDEDGNLKQVSVVNIASPIKCELIYNEHCDNEQDKSKNMEKTEKIRCESEKDEKTILKELKKILESNMNIHKKKYGIYNIKKFGVEGMYFDEENENYEEDDISELVEEIQYLKDEEKKYSLDMKNSFHRIICMISYLFINRCFE